MSSEKVTMDTKDFQSFYQPAHLHEVSFYKKVIIKGTPFLQALWSIRPITSGSGIFTSYQPYKKVKKLCKNTVHVVDLQNYNHDLALKSNVGLRI